MQFALSNELFYADYDSDVRFACLLKKPQTYFNLNISFGTKILKININIKFDYIYNNNNAYI